MLGFAPIATTPLGAPSANEAFSLQAQTGVYALSMQGAGKLITDIYPSGSFTLNGRAAGFSAQRPANFAAGTFTLVGQNITLDQGYGVIANNASYTLTGQNITFDTGFGVVVVSGSFTVTGQSINVDIAMNAESGSFTLTGQDALKGIGESVDQATFTVTYQDAAVTAQKKITAENQSQTLTGHEIDIRGFLSAYVPPEIWTEVA